jgi:hypothetical protein
MAAGPGGARQAEVSEARRKGLPSGAAGPGSGAAATWYTWPWLRGQIHRAASGASEASRQAGFYEHASERERPERSVKSVF